MTKHLSPDLMSKRIGDIFAYDSQLTQNIPNDTQTTWDLVAEDVHLNADWLGGAGEVIVPEGFDFIEVYMYFRWASPGGTYRRAWVDLTDADLTELANEEEYVGSVVKPQVIVGMVKVDPASPTTLTFYARHDNGGTAFFQRKRIFLRCWKAE